MAMYALFKKEDLQNSAMSFGEERAKVEQSLRDEEHGVYTLVKILTDLEVGPPKRETTTVVRTSKTYNPRGANGTGS